MKNTIREKRGITLIALVITVIVLLILAAVSISTLTGENGILIQAVKSKKQTIIGQEKEQVEISYVSAEMKKIDGKVTRKNLQDELDTLLGKGKTNVTNKQNEDGYLGIEVTFTETNNNYFVESGNVRVAEKDEFKQEITGVYAILYSDGDLRFNTTGSENQEKIESENSVVYKSDDFSTTLFDNPYSCPWYSYASTIKTVTFEEKIAPQYTRAWFPCSALEKINSIQNLNTSNVNDMVGMFYGCKSLTSLDVSNFDTSNVTSMKSMFYGCESLISLDVSNFDTSNVTDMGFIFYGCKSLTSLDVSNFDTSNVTSMAAMFDFCSSLTSLDVSNFDTSNVTHMGNMFAYCSSLTSLDVSNFDTSSVKFMTAMFNGCISLTSLDLSSFDTSKVTSMRCMFQNASVLQVIYVGNKWIINEGTDTSYIFGNCGVNEVTTKI